MENKRALYWTAQFSGWLTYVFILAVWSLFTGQFEWPSIKVWITVFFTGIFVSHLMRGLILRRGWLKLHLYHAIWRLFLLALVFGILGALIHGAISDVVVPEIPSFLVWPPLALAQVVLAYAPELFIWSLIYFSWNYFRNYEREEVKNLRLQASKNEVELHNLRSQLNPHFMFNAMNSIRALIDENPELAKRSVTQLSMILRNTLIAGKHKFIPLEDELNVVQNYLELEGIRYEERLQVSYHIDPEVLKEPIPPLMLQTLAENAIKHGIAKLIEGGEVEIKCQKTPAGFYIAVVNSGSLDSSEESLTGIGLSNTRKRLELLYNGSANFDIYARDGRVTAQIHFNKTHP